MRPAWPLVLLGFVLVDDALTRAIDPGYAVLGLLDEPAHLATGALVTTAVATVLGGLPRATWVAALISTVLIDLDHLPDALGSDVLTAGTPRPYTHALTTVVVLALVAVGTRGRTTSTIFAGCVIGVSAHLLRDVGTAPVALWWPISDVGVSMPYVAYTAALVVAVAVIMAAGGRRPYVRRPPARVS